MGHVFRRALSIDPSIEFVATSIHARGLAGAIPIAAEIEAEIESTLRTDSTDRTAQIPGPAKDYA